MSIKYEPTSEPKKNETRHQGVVVTILVMCGVGNNLLLLQRESSLLTTYWSEST